MDDVIKIGYLAIIIGFFRFAFFLKKCVLAAQGSEIILLGLVVIGGIEAMSLAGIIGSIALVFTDKSFTIMHFTLFMSVLSVLWLGSLAARRN